MVRLRLISLLALVGWFGLLCAEGPKYRLIWEEHFKGKEINNTYWSKIPRGGAEWQVHMSAHESLYDVSHGKLTLKGVANNGNYPDDPKEYLTGGIYTKGKVSVGFGKVEVRAKLEGAQSAWPAIWMLPEGGTWPKDGEIDIMERLHKNPFIHQTVHSDYTEVVKEIKNPPYGTTTPFKTDKYNVFAVEILPDSLVFSVNGTTTFTYPKLKPEIEGQYPFGTPYYILIDMQIGASWMEKPNPEDFPIEMKVDWVKFYELEQE